MQFTKMHGCGNDYIFLDCLNRPLPDEPAQLATRISDRHKGVGSDGLILIAPSERANARMLMWNADGSRGEMCGNGIRCVAKFLFEHGDLHEEEISIESDRGVHSLRLLIEEGQVEKVRVNMGEPFLKAAKIPTTLPGDPPLDVELELGESLNDFPSTIKVTCISMGNPHCIVFTNRITDEMVLGWGPTIENHAAFPQRTNVEFVRVISPHEIAMRVWERGSGETQACGTGACATTVAAAISKRTERNVKCHLLGGSLDIAWSDSNEVYMTGPAVEVFTGEWQE